MALPIWLIANSKNGISSHELGRAIGVTQKSAWFVMHRIRLAMQTGTFDRFDGEVEVDETFVGGKAVQARTCEARKGITQRSRSRPSWRAHSTVDDGPVASPRAGRAQRRAARLSKYVTRT